ncbi:hypothetical protein T4B_13193 [Trichinella pseudospiralis]|uniref:Uncharacterized protein n=1 Tax=Trichinella pseudospiralis TaxID=6337 RepID=A0A0V1IPG6_TRIPS|nr:hypothetical protein T4B_13193 [Trichinella pseudospiralis]
MGWDGGREMCNHVVVYMDCWRLLFYDIRENMRYNSVKGSDGIVPPELLPAAVNGTRVRLRVIVIIITTVLFSHLVVENSRRPHAGCTPLLFCFLYNVNQRATDKPPALCWRSQLTIHCIVRSSGPVRPVVTVPSTAAFIIFPA